MTNPAVETIPDGTPDPDLSFLADFDAQMGGVQSPFSEEPERSSAPATDAATPAPADVPTEPAPETPSDPAASAKEPDAIASTPLDYTVNGEKKIADWALRVGDEGVVVPPQHIGKLQDLIQRDEWQARQNRELYAQTQKYEALTHKIGDEEFRGVEAFRQLQAEKAMLDASGGAVMAALADPQFVTDLALAYQSGDQSQVESTLARILTQVKREGEYAQFKTLRDASTQETTMARQQETSHVQDAEYQQIVSDIGKALPALTPDDLKVMQDYFTPLRDRIFRPATVEEAKQFHIRPGTIIKDPTVMNQWAQDRAALRSQHTSAVAAASKAAQENAARQAPRVASKPTKRPAAPATPATPGKRFPKDDGSYQAWKNEMQAGRFTGVEESE